MPNTEEDALDAEIDAYFRARNEGLRILRYWGIKEKEDKETMIKQSHNNHMVYASPAFIALAQASLKEQ